MSTIALQNREALNNNKKGSIKERIAQYFMKNQNMIALGMYSISGITPDVELLREMKIL